MLCTLYHECPPPQSKRYKNGWFEVPKEAVVVQPRTTYLYTLTGRKAKNTVPHLHNARETVSEGTVTASNNLAGRPVHTKLGVYNTEEGGQKR